MGGLYDPVIPNRVSGEEPAGPLQRVCPRQEHPGRFDWTTSNLLHPATSRFLPATRFGMTQCGCPLKARNEKLRIKQADAKWAACTKLSFRTASAERNLLVPCRECALEGTPRTVRLDDEQPARPGNQQVPPAKAVRNELTIQYKFFACQSALRTPVFGTTETRTARNISIAAIYSDRAQ